MAKLLSYKSARAPLFNRVIAMISMVISFPIFGALPTQWFASKYLYDSNLGEPLFGIGRVFLYLPVEWMWWTWRLADVPGLKLSVYFMVLLGVVSLLMSIAVALFIAHRLSKHDGGMEGLHGTAHWAERSDVNNTGFLATPDYDPIGVVVGSVISDSKGQIIHPHHKDYAKRYMAVYVHGKGIHWFKKIQKRDGNGQPVFAINKSVVKKVDILRDAKNTHIFAFCPTRSGKGVGMIIPTLVTWPYSVMVNDPKGEAFALTSGFRKAAGQEIIKFMPACTDGTGARWNPLDEIRIFTHHDVKDAQMIMAMACDPKGEGLADYFDKAGYEFLMGLALHVRYAEKNGSLEGVAQFLGDPSWDSDKQMYNHMMQAEHDPEGKMGWKDSAGSPTKTHPIIANTAKTMLIKEDKDRSGVLSTAKSLLSLYLDPIVAQNTNCSDFLVRDIMTHSKPVSLYYVVEPEDMERMVPLTRLFYALFIRRNASDMHFEKGQTKKSYTFQMLMVLDEMASLQKLPIIQEALGYVAGYGIRMFMLVQDIAQVEDLYSDKQTIDSGAESRIAYAPNKLETAEKLSKMAGKTTVTEEKASHSHETFGLKGGSVSISTDKVSRDLIAADEFMRLSDQDVIIFVKGQPPIYGRKAFFYENEVMKARASMSPPTKSSVLRGQIVAPEKIVITPVEPETPTERWAASRAELKSRLHAGLGSSEIFPDIKVDGAEQIVVKKAAAGSIAPATSAGTVRPRSRYARPETTISPEEKAHIEALVADVALTEKIMKISAFK